MFIYIYIYIYIYLQIHIYILRYELNETTKINAHHAVCAVCNENENENEHIKVYMHAHTNTHRYPFVRTDTCAHRSGKFSIVGGALDTEPRMRMREKNNKRISMDILLRATSMVKVSIRHM